MYCGGRPRSVAWAPTWEWLGNQRTHRCLEKAVVEATANRQEENSDFQNLVASNSAAKELLAFAKNCLNRFGRFPAVVSALLARVREMLNGSQH